MSSSDHINARRATDLKILFKRAGKRTVHLFLLLKNYKFLTSTGTYLGSCYFLSGVKVYAFYDELDKSFGSFVKFFLYPKLIRKTSRRWKDVRLLHDRLRRRSFLWYSLLMEPENWSRPLLTLSLDLTSIRHNFW